jgi:hypothetical protein
MRMPVFIFSSVFDNFCKVPRTHNNEVNAAQSLVLNDNQLPSKKVYTSKPPHHNRKGIRCKKKKLSLNYKAEWDTPCLSNRTHHIQLYSTTVATSDKIAINKTPLVITPLKEDSTSNPEPQNLRQKGWV